MKKIFNISAGAAAGLFIVLLANPLIGELSLKTFGGITADLLAAILPIVLTVILIELSLVFAGRRKKDDFQISLLLFQLTLTGYLLFFIFTLVYYVVLKSTAGSLLLTTMVQSGYSHQYQIITVLITALIILSYINLFVKRMKKTIPTVIDHKAGNINDVKK